MRTLSLLIGVALSTCIPLTATAAAPVYRIVEIAPPTESVDGQFLGGAESINSLRQFVGNIATLDGSRAFIWDPTTKKFTLLPVLGTATESFAYGINDKGQIAGQSGERAVVWKKGVIKALAKFPGQTSSEARAINESGRHGIARDVALGTEQ